jgi:hypothetical protein
MEKLISSRGPSLLLKHRRIAHATAHTQPQPLNLQGNALIPGSLVTDHELPAAHPDGEIADVGIVKNIVSTLLAGKLISPDPIWLGDKRYYLATEEEVKQIINGSHLELKRWIAERFDCDDFSYVLKAFFSSIAYQTNQLSCGVCAGIIWGLFEWTDEFHSCNWFIDSDHLLKFIEPQNGTIYPVSACEGKVNFIAA